MIQRIQTVYLALAFAALLSLFLFPIIEYSAVVTSKETSAVKFNKWKYKIYAFEETADDPKTKQTPDFYKFYYYNIATAALILSVIALSISSFRSRKRQLSLIWVAILGILVETMLIYLKVNEATSEERILDPGAFLISLALLLTLLAQRSVRKDEQLVRSADRLR